MEQNRWLLPPDGAVLVIGDQVVSLPGGHSLRLHVPRHASVGKLVREPATGQIWSSALQLARDLGYAPGTIYAHLNGNPAYPRVGGRVFEYLK